MLVAVILGENVAEADNTLRSQIAKTEISLKLSNKHELPNSAETDVARLILRFVSATNLQLALVFVAMWLGGIMFTALDWCSVSQPI